MAWSGMNKKTGRAIEDIEHIRQSIADILTTPIGTRIMRRNYGSVIFELIDQPQNPATNLKLMAATVMAIMAWEPRVAISAVDVRRTDTGCEMDVIGHHQETNQELSFEGVAAWQ